MLYVWERFDVPLSLNINEHPLKTAVRSNAGGEPQQLTLIEEIPVLEAFIHGFNQMVESTNHL